MPSPVWLHFVKFTEKDGVKVRCKLCQKVMNFLNNTTNMIYHIKGVHKIDLSTLPAKGGKPKRTSTHQQEQVSSSFNEDDEEMTVDDPAPITQEDNLGAAKGTARSFPSPLKTCIDAQNAYAPGRSRDAQCLNALLYMVSKDTMPLSTPNRAGFRKYSQTLQPLFKIPPTTTLVRLLEGKYEVLRERVAGLLDKAESITITVDLWSHKSTMKSHLGVTAHVLVGIELLSLELAAVPMEERKTKDNLRRALRTVCEKWKIRKENVEAVVSDGGANIKAAVKAEFGEEKHVSCLAHQINLIGQKIIGNTTSAVPTEREVPPADLPENESDVDEGDCDIFIPDGSPENIRQLILKVKRIVRFFRQSEVASTQLLRSQRDWLKKEKERNVQQETSQENRNAQKKDSITEPLKLIQEVVTRWNSCYDMLDRYLLLGKFVNEVLYDVQSDRSTKSTPPDVILPSEENILREIRYLLAPLARTTKELSTDRTTTLSKCIPVVTRLREETEKYIPNSTIGKNLKRDLLQQINEKFGSIEDVQMYAVATLCDPRFKKVAFHNDEKTPLRVSKALCTLSDLVKSKMRGKRSADMAAEAMQVEYQTADDDFWSDFDRKAEAHSSKSSGQDTAGGIPVQLRMYLDSPLVNRKDTPNPLVPWEVYKGEYKYVYEIARKYLSIVATSVPAERLFSHAGLIASQLRTRLSGQHLDMLVFLRSCPDKFWF